MDVAEKIRRFNAGRDPERLAMKLQKMRSNPFIFLRGTCHLFYDALPRHEIFSHAPVTWICGDLHLENFGSYKGDNRLAYFDINDFDEAVLAPCTWDLVRFLVSVQLGMQDLSVNEREIGLLCQTFVDAYSAALHEGKARWIERETATGLVEDLLQNLSLRSRQKFLDSRTEPKARGHHRAIRCDGRKALPANDADRIRIEALLSTLSHTRENPDFYRVIDVARRIAGTGSLGVARYIILVEGKGSPDANYLLDLKEAVPSSLLPCLKTRQPVWRSEAERVVTLQNRMQAISMAFLHAVEMDGKCYILRGLQPSEDRVDLSAWNGRLRRLEEVMISMGQLTAWAHLRSGGRQGSANADVLIGFAQDKAWHRSLLEVATQCTARVTLDWKTYADAYDHGYYRPD